MSTKKECRHCAGTALARRGTARLGAAGRAHPSARAAPCFGDLGSSPRSCAEPEVAAE